MLRVPTWLGGPQKDRPIGNRGRKEEEKKGEEQATILVQYDQQMVQQDLLVAREKVISLLIWLLTPSSPSRDQINLTPIY